ncbi:MAG: hypothetical protein ACRYFR_02735 [Janthinobacterium lividum]
MEEYAAKMQAKSLAELQQYVSGHAQYRDDAVLAALAELRRRGQPAPEEDALRPGLETAVAQQRVEAAAAEALRRRTAPFNPDEAEGPELFSPGTIVLFSLMFSMVGGGILLGINLYRLRRLQALAGLVAFLLGCLLAGGYALRWAAATANPMALLLVPVVVNVLALAAFFLWFWPRYVGPEPYRSRSWLLPFLLCMAVALVLRSFLPMLNKDEHGAPIVPGSAPSAAPGPTAAPTKAV